MPARADAGEWFDLSDAAAAALRTASGEAASDPRASAWRERFGTAMADALGAPSEQPELAHLVSSELPDVGEALRQQLPLVGLADALDAAVGLLRGRGIGDDVIHASLADVGRTERKNHVWFGRPGLDAELAVWANRHLYGAIFQLGRLQFERVGMGERTAAGIAAAGGRAKRGDLALSIHIPAGLGPMSPAAVDGSIEQARRFFARHFPDERPRYAICISWLLDPQLAEYLPESSNIVSFQRRFALGPADPGAAPSDDVVQRFVFGTAAVPLGAQPRSSTLERAIHDHLAAGRHFATPRGWFDL